MKKIVLIVVLSIVASCSPTKKNEAKPLFEILWEESYGGTKIEFYEIFTEPNEFKLFLKNPDFKDKVSSKDIETSNFVILNHGERNTGGYTIGVESVRETNENIVIKIKKTAPKAFENVTYAFTAPVCIVKINSKKTIVFEE